MNDFFIFGGIVVYELIVCFDFVCFCFGDGEFDFIFIFLFGEFGCGDCFFIDVSNGCMCVKWLRCLFGDVVIG